MEDKELDLVVNPVNIVGIMGGGLARALRDKYPDHFRVYKKLCNIHQLSNREVVLVASGVPQPRGIILFPTKTHWIEPSDIAMIDHNLRELAKLLKTREEQNEIVGLPAVGCGLGGLSFDDVFMSIQLFLRETKQEVRVFTGP